jgi:hypothetical protein
MVQIGRYIHSNPWEPFPQGNFPTGKAVIGPMFVPILPNLTGRSANFKKGWSITKPA